MGLTQDVLYIREHYKRPYNFILRVTFMFRMDYYTAKILKENIIKAYTILEMRKVPMDTQSRKYKRPTCDYIKTLTL